MSVGGCILLIETFPPHLTLMFNGCEDMISHFPSRNFLASGSVELVSTEIKQNLSIPFEMFERFE